MNEGEYKGVCECVSEGEWIRVCMWGMSEWMSEWVCEY